MTHRSIPVFDINQSFMRNLTERLEDEQSLPDLSPAHQAVFDDAANAVRDLWGPVVAAQSACVAAGDDLLDGEVLDRYIDASETWLQQAERLHFMLENEYEWPEA